MQEEIMASVQDTSDTGGRLIAAGKVNGTAVYDARGEKIGNVYDIMIDKASGKADYAILNFGSFLGMGGRYHPLPWNQLTYDPGAGGFVVNLDKSRLEGAPSYADDDVSLWDDRRSTDIDTYYGDDRDVRVAPGVGPGLGGMGTR
jgi:hypothetical protein